MFSKILEILHFMLGLLIPTFGIFCAVQYYYLLAASAQANWRIASIFGATGSVLWCLIGTLGLSLVHQLTFLPMLLWWVGGTVIALVMAYQAVRKRGIKLGRGSPTDILVRFNASNLLKEFVFCFLLSGFIIFLQFVFTRILFQSPADLSYRPITVWWGISSILLLVFFRLIVAPDKSVSQLSFWEQLYRTDIWITSAGICLVVGGALICASFSPPNNWDVMSYHLPRQIIWMSDKSVLLFSDPKLYFAITKMPPLSEYLGVNLYLLSGSDRWHNLVQWTALLFSLNFISLIMENMKFTRRAQLFAGLVFCTVPLVYFHASDSKNDLLLTTFILAIAWSITSVKENKTFSNRAGVFCGLNAGFALLTKATAIAFLPIVGLFAILFLWYSRVKVEVTSIFVLLACCFCISGYHYFAEARTNIKTEIGANSDHVNSDFTPTAMLSVLSRNYILQLSTPSKRLNQFLLSVNETIHHVLKREMNDSKTTFGGTNFRVTYLPTLEGCATSLPLFGTILLLPLLAYWQKWWNTSREMIFMTALAYCLLIGFSWIFRWQPYHSRLLVPVYAFAAIPTGVVISGIRNRILSAVIGLVFILWLFPSFYSWDRPLLGSRSVIITGEEEKRCLAQGNGEINLALRRLIQHGKPKSLFIDLGNKISYPIYPIYEALKLPEGKWPKIGRKLIPTDKYEAVILGEGHETQDAGLLATMANVFDQDGWQLWLNKDAGERALQGAPGPFFGYKEFSSPVGAFQGPYPPTPAFRHFYYPDAVLKIPGSSYQRKLQLVIQNEPGNKPNECIVYIDKKQIAQFRISDEQDNKSIDIPLGLITGDFMLRLVFSSGITSQYEPHPVAARVFKLQVIKD